jgi:hypothetical protein
MNLHNEIMNIIINPKDMPACESIAYKQGHRDARHAAAELALKYVATTKEKNAVPNAELAIKTD